MAGGPVGPIAKQDPHYITAECVLESFAQQLGAAEAMARRLGQLAEVLDGPLTNPDRAHGPTVDRAGILLDVLLNRVNVLEFMLEGMAVDVGRMERRLGIPGPSSSSADCVAATSKWLGLRGDGTEAAPRRW